METFWRKSPESDLVAISIEDASPSENGSDRTFSGGEEIIDVAEYEGSEQFEEASSVRYFQLKHSTLRAQENWNPSELETTLRKFAGQFEKRRQAVGLEATLAKLSLRFISNRPVAPSFLETVTQLSKCLNVVNAENLGKLEKFTNLSGVNLCNFCSILRFDCQELGYLAQRSMLLRRTRAYLPELNNDVALKLKDLIARKASSEYKNDPVIKRLDVLGAFDIEDEQELFPAPCLIQAVANAVPREQEAALTKAIIDAVGYPVIIHAEAGVGKSIFATRIQRGLPNGSLAVVYDCFGNGQYRNPTGYRHRHRDAITQIVNELASGGLCDILLPVPNAQSGSYLKTFCSRLTQCIATLRSKAPEALLCIAIDAADNAQMAAQDSGDNRAFILDLLGEQLPDGVRLVALCRTHRQDRLAPPPNTLALELKAFTEAESRSTLLKAFPDATDNDVREFHSLSSHNPRVQALALSSKEKLSTILLGLGPAPTTVDETIRKLLDDAIQRLRYESGVTEQNQIDRICSGLAVLRPLIPVSVLAFISNVPPEAIRSFALDIGRPLMVTDDTIQFVDEPSETWFIETFAPKLEGLRSFASSLLSLSGSNAYAAAVLPQIMLEAGQHTELVELALKSGGLPTTSPVEHREIELQRLQFALKASLRQRRYVDAAKLAFKCGGECAGHLRQQELIQSNTDLAGVFTSASGIREIIAGRTFTTRWLGSRSAYDAGLLSFIPELVGQARSSLRIAEEWLTNWSKVPSDDEDRKEVPDSDIAEMAIAHLNIHGAGACAYFLRRWTPRQISFRVGRLVARRMIDHGRYTDLDAAALAAGNDVYLLLAISLELREVHRILPEKAAKRGLRLLSDERIEIAAFERMDYKQTVLQAITAFVECCCKLAVGAAYDLASLLSRYLPKSPPPGFGWRYSHETSPLLRAYCLRSALRGEVLTAIDLAHGELREKLAKENQPYSQEAREFNENVASVLPWFQLWADTLLSRIPAADITSAMNAASAASLNISDGENLTRFNQLRRLSFQILVEGNSLDGATLKDVQERKESNRLLLTPDTLIFLARTVSRLRVPGLNEWALDAVNKAYEIVVNEREVAEIKCQSLMDAARAVLVIAPEDSRFYFEEAIKVASKIGEENLHRWRAIIDLADHARTSGSRFSQTAYRFARCAEVTYQYVDRDKHFDWDSTVTAIASLCPASSVAIVSRWRDRGFGDHARLLPTVVEFLIDNNHLDARTALPLVGYRFEWDHPHLLKRAVEEFQTTTERAEAARFLTRYMSFGKTSSTQWQRTKDILLQNGLQDSLNTAVIDPALEKSRETEKAQGYRELADVSEPEGIDISYLFEGIDLTKGEDLLKLRNRVNELGLPYARTRLFKECWRRIEVGHQIQLIHAVANVATELELYDIAAFLETVPDIIKNRAAVKAAFAQEAPALCRSCCLDIEVNRHYEVFPLRLLSELSGLSLPQIVEIILSEIGKLSGPLGPQRLFSLISLLVNAMSAADSLEALEFALTDQERSFEDKDGDGPWSSDLQPATDPESAIAGYVWATLAAPQTHLRWEAAHVVCGLAAMGRTAVLDSLVRLCKAGGGSPFVDARLDFYRLHAHLWLLIALARAAKQQPALISRHGDFLVDVAANGDPHILIRGFAADAALTLVESGQFDPSPEIVTALKQVNRSPFPPADAKALETVSPKESGSNDEDHGIHFGIDIGPHFFAPLARCFGVSQDTFEGLAWKVISVDWKHPGEVRWKEDQRIKQHIFKNGENYHHHSSSPDSDDLCFYFSYHAMMAVGGRLLQTHCLHKPFSWSDEGFEEWLSDHKLVRSDGYWISDRRDTSPTPVLEARNGNLRTEWPWSLTRDAFDKQLRSPDGRINLSGHWTEEFYDCEETVIISSALVSQEHSEALLRALQTADHVHDYKIPDSGDESEIVFDQFQLKGWIAKSHYKDGLDRRDPWAGEISYPAIMPAQYVIEGMVLHSDGERREWRFDGQFNAVCWSHVWGDSKNPNARKSGYSSRGQLFQTTAHFVKQLLEKVQMDLIIEVEIRRYGESKDVGYVQPSARLFVAKHDGNFYAI
jgi:hypothetical protein